MYTSTKAVQKPSFLPMETPSNHRFNIPGGAVGFSTVPQAAAVTFTDFTFSLSHWHPRCCKEVGRAMRVRKCPEVTISYKPLLLPNGPQNLVSSLTLVPPEHQRAADLSISKLLDYETALTMMYN